MKKLFDEAQLWYRGNLHTHTSRSDGKLSPDEAIALYKSEGYSFMAITDHRICYDSWEKDGFTLLGGTELDYNDMKSRTAWHIIGIGIEREVKHIRGDTAPVMVKSIRDAGGLAILGHPHWSLLTPADMIGLDNIFATEIYSGVSEAYSGRGDSSGFADTCMSKGCARMLLGVDDTHYYDKDLFRAWIMLKAPTLSREDILCALEAGSFYATEGGPGFLQISIDEDSIMVECEASARIAFYSDMFYNLERIRFAGDTPLTYAEYKITPNDNYVRIELTGADGKRTSSQYIRVNDYK